MVIQDFNPYYESNLIGIQILFMFCLVQSYNWSRNYLGNYLYYKRREITYYFKLLKFKYYGRK